MKIIAALAAAILMCSMITMATSISIGNSYAQPAVDSPPLYDYWQPIDTPSDVNAVAPAADTNQVNWQSQTNQDSPSWQQDATSNQQSNANWSPSSGVEAASAPVQQQQQQQQYPASTASPNPSVQPLAYGTTSASYQSPSTTGSSSYPQPAAVAATERGCAEGTRKPVPEQLSSYIICDNGVWIAMTCAPGTVFNALREQCMIGRASVTIAIRSQKQPNQQSQPTSSSSSSSNQQQGIGQQSQSQTQSQTNVVQSVPSANQYPQQVQQQQQQQQQQFATRAQPSTYGVQQSASTTVQQAYVQPVGNSNNNSAPSYNSQQIQPQQPTQYQQQSQTSQPQAYQQQVQQVTQQPAVAGGYVATNAQPRQVYQQQRPQQQQAQQQLAVKPVKVYVSSQGVQSQATNANSQYQQVVPGSQNQQVQSQQPLYAVKPSSSQPASAAQAPRQQSSNRPSGTGIAQGWQPAPASQLQQSGSGVSGSQWQSVGVSGQQASQQVQQSQASVQATTNQASSYQKVNANPSNSYQQPSAAAASAYQAPAAAQPSSAASTNQAPAAVQQYSQQSAAAQTQTSYELQPAQQQSIDANSGKVKITVAI